jgi:hypothetical protein
MLTNGARGFLARRLYRSDYEENLYVLRPSPLHDWISHAFRYLAITIDRQAAVTGFNRRLDYPRLGLR